MGERYSGDDFRRIGKLVHDEGAISFAALLYSQAAATEDALVKLCAKVRVDEQIAVASADLWRPILERLGLWRDPEDCPHCRAERQVGCQRCKA